VFAEVEDNRNVALCKEKCAVIPQQVTNPVCKAHRP
jgi:hypothetical protein